MIECLYIQCFYLYMAGGKLKCNQMINDGNNATGHRRKKQAGAELSEAQFKLEIIEVKS